MVYFAWKLLFMSSNNSPSENTCVELSLLNFFELQLFGTKMWHYCYQFQIARLDGLTGSSSRKAEQIK